MHALKAAAAGGPAAPAQAQTAVDPTCPPAPRNQPLTQLIYLSACGGGETNFYVSRNRRIASVAPQPGMALLHKHGDCCLDHEGAAVTAGTKYVLRSDVVFRQHGG